MTSGGGADDDEGRRDGVDTTAGTQLEPDDDDELDDEFEDDLAAAVVGALTASGTTVAVAESITGGLVCAAITDVPGASAVLRGGIVAYATDLKAELLGVSPALLHTAGPVHPVVASMMATSVRQRLGATYGLATTGVAGPDRQHDMAVGTVYVALDGPDGSSVERYQLDGDRADVRDESVAAALRLLLAEATSRAER